MKIWMFALWLVVFAGGSAGAQTTQPLFFIERSLNANIVRYDARLTAESVLDTQEPVVAYWIMKAQDHRREALNFLERRMAYGFSVSPAAEAGVYAMTLVSFKDRVIRVYLRDRQARAETSIDGRPALLDKVSIHTGSAMGRPESLALSGRDVQTGQRRSETVRP